MGLNVSRQVELSENEHLKMFVGKDHIPVSHDEFWNVFLQFQISLPATEQEQLSLDSRLETLCQSFVNHNLSTGNFGSLLSIFVQKVEDLLVISEEESPRYAWETFNALFVIRCLTKYLIETSTEYQLLQHFEALPASAEGAAEGETQFSGCRFETFYTSVVKLLSLFPLRDATYHLHLEAVNVIIVLLSVHLFSPQPTERSSIFKTIYKNPYANTLTSVLLSFVGKMKPLPATMFGLTSGTSIVFGIAESIWSLLTFGSKRATAEQLEPNQPDIVTAFREHYPLTNQSLLLLLILVNHNMQSGNEYRDSLFNCTNVVSDPTSLGTKETDPKAIHVDFQQLYKTLTQIVKIDQATLLLYILLHRNAKFYRFVMEQSNIDQLVTPILHTLYCGPDSTSHHIYMSLIVLLILSEDEGFNKSIHQINLKNITWYTEKYLSEVSLGGLLVLVVIRTIQYNMLKTRDKYLHTNCLAALANMSSQFRNLHPYVSQRLISLFETLAKKHNRLSALLKEGATPPQNGGDVSINLVSSLDETTQDLSVLEEVLRMVLEILNSCLSNQLVHCPNLVYTLLYKKDVFEPFRRHPAFQDIIQNIDMVVGFFSSRLQRVQDQRGELGVNEVLEVISKGATQWSSDRLRKFPDLKFKYVEEDAPEEFFIPYVWSLVCNGNVYFSSETIKSVTTNVNC